MGVRADLFFLFLEWGLFVAVAAAGNDDVDWKEKAQLLQAVTCWVLWRQGIAQV